MKVGLPILPQGYGVPEHHESFMAWSEVEERLKGSKNYWVCTVRPDGRPHCTPVWGVWLDGCLYIEGSSETRRARNMSANPAVSVHLEDGDKAVIVEGVASEIPKPDRELALKLSKTYSEKYAPVGYTPGPENWDHGGLFVIHPKTALAWTSFPKDTTKFEF